ncbi:hypothetical protein SAMN06295967_1031 [Belliella buryatensis]|uniref:Uncharacterized protein n=1 Tax=Belliella buryatensis TaxID=1500549 RepID=A0A239BK81_9BACT|nr:hypothetical protein SAMN06295967_1031 [Belliella buryatensis]
MGQSFIKTSYLAWFKNLLGFLMVISNCRSIQIFNESIKTSIQRFFGLTTASDVNSGFQISNFQVLVITVEETHSGATLKS